MTNLRNGSLQKQRPNPAPLTIEKSRIKITPKAIEHHINELFREDDKTIYTGTELMDLRISKIPFLIEGVFQSVGLAALVGSSDVGKSTILRQLALCVIGFKKDFLGFQVNVVQSKVIYVATEDDPNAISFLLRKQVGSNSEATPKLGNLRFLFDSMDLEVRIDAMLSEQPADLVIIDCFADIFLDDMNQVNKVRSVLNKYATIARKHQCLILFLHHTGKGKEHDPPSKNNSVGSHGFEAKMRLVAEFRKDPMDPTKKHFCIVKANYLAESMKGESFELSQDDSMWFSPTGNRVEFSRLVKPQKVNDTPDKRSIAFEMFQTGKKQAEIAAELGVSTGAVSKWHKTFRKENEDGTKLGSSES